MKKILFVLVAILISLPTFSTNSEAQQFTTTQVLVYSDDCYDVFIEVTYMVNTTWSVIDINMGPVSFKQKATGCDPDIMEVYESNKLELLRLWKYDVIEQVFEESGEQPRVCDKDEPFQTATITQASCESIRPVHVRNDSIVDPKTGDTTLTPVYEYIPCAEDVRCCSVYEICWVWDPDSQTFKMRKTFIRTIPESFGQPCPSTIDYIPLYPDIPITTVPCHTICDEDLNQ